MGGKSPRLRAAASAIGFVALASAGSAWAANAPGPGLRDLCPDRPTKGTGACTVDRGRWQVEADLFNTTLQRESGVAVRTTLLANPTLKFGLTDVSDIEVAIAADEIVRTVDTVSGAHRSLAGPGDLFLKYKHMLTAQGGAFQAVLLPWIKAPTARRGIGNGAWEAGVVTPLQWTLPGGWQLGASPEVDAIRNGDRRGYHAAASIPVSLTHTIVPGLSASVELWAAEDFDPGGDSRQSSFDLALAQLVGHDIQLDAGINVGLNRATARSQSYVGVTRRF